MNRIEPYYMQDIKLRQLEMHRKLKPSIHLEMSSHNKFKQGETIRDFEKTHQ
jgi:hypothetical protein